MKRKPYSAAALVAVLVLAAVPALADVPGTLQAGGDWLVTVVQAALVIGGVVIGVMLFRGFGAIAAIIPIVIGFAIALNPQEIAGWIR
jgi:hypothetical protein